MLLNTGAFQIYRGHETRLHPVFVVGLSVMAVDFEIADFPVELGQSLTLVFQGPQRPDLAVFVTVGSKEEIQRFEPCATFGNSPSVRVSCPFQQPVSPEMLQYLQDNFFHEKAHVLSSQNKKEVKRSPLLKWAYKFGFDFTDD